jgi:acetoin utilization deacetylase AcuC-like enzyme
MTLLYYHPVFLEHETGSHPERSERLRRIVAHLAETGADQKCQRPQFGPVDLARLARVHRLEYVEEIRDFSAQHGGHVDADTIISEKSYEAALTAAGAVCDAVQRAVAGDERRALCLVRPPGHHALPQRAMGFCLFNNAAVAARLATTELDVDRVLIVDWDVHHGNGTQDVFWDDEQVGFFSVHRWPFYPGTGSPHETGAGRAIGTTQNLPILFGTSRLKYLNDFGNQIQDFADKIKPQLVIISAGFDSHRSDPIGSLGLEVDDFAAMTRRIAEIAKVHAQGRVISVLEGGYNVDVLPLCVAAHLEALHEEQL